MLFDQDPSEAFTEDEFIAYNCCQECGYEFEDCDCGHDYDDDDGQPDMYTEYQDLYGGDDWDHGQYDEF